jgi:hypothetical protein
LEPDGVACGATGRSAMDFPRCRYGLTERPPIEREALLGLLGVVAGIVVLVYPDLSLVSLAWVMGIWSSRCSRRTWT